jgi:hypothetical protein
MLKGQSITLAEKTYDVETGSGFLEVFRPSDADEFHLTVFCGSDDLTLYKVKQSELGEIGRKLVALSDDNHTQQVIADAEAAIKISDGVDRLKADREEAKHYAAVLYGITSSRPDMPVSDRAALADAIVSVQRERKLVD